MVEQGTIRRVCRHRGAATLEFLLVAPLLVIVFLGAVVFGTTLTVHHASVSAVAEGAREGAKVPTTLGAADGERVVAAVLDTVETILGTHLSGLDITAPDSGVLIIVEDASGVACRGDNTLNGQTIPCPAATTVTDPAVVRVTLFAEVSRLPIPNLLQMHGLDLDQKLLQLTAVARRD